MEICECKNEYYVCQAAFGCSCRHGYGGPNCDEELFLRNTQEKTSYGSIVVGFLFAAIAVAAMAFAGWLYHRRRVADLKNEIAQVQYIAEPASPPEQTQFDNPVYAFQGCSKFDDGTTTLLNNFQFKNNLGTNKKLNNEKVRLGMNCTDDEDDCKGSYNRYDLKNKDADMANPNLNVYHSIDEMDGKKIEHVYDEIKQNNDSDYDLDNSRPTSTYNKYSRMPNGFPKSSDNAGPSTMRDKDPELGET